MAYCSRLLVLHGARGGLQDPYLVGGYDGANRGD